jgi:VWFA-related protein
MKIVPLVLLLLVTHRVSPAQSSGQQPQNTPQVPLIRTTTRLVQLNVVALDKQNHPVTDLTKEDFRVFDNGVEQQIAHFTGAVADAPTDPATHSPLAINNRQNSGEAVHGVTAILMDELILDSKDRQSVCTGSYPNDPCTTIRQMRLQVLEFLSKLPPGEVVGIYALRAVGVIVIHDFSDDPASLAAAAKSLGGEGLRSRSTDHLVSSTTRALVRWTQNSPTQGTGQKIQSSEDADRLMTGYGFQAVVKHLEGIPGRKNLVWVSSTLPVQASGFNIAQMAAASTANTPIDLNNLSNVGMLATEIYPDPQNHFEEVRKFGRWLADSNIAIYPFDAYGLQAGGPEGPQVGDNRYAQWAAADLIATESGGKALVGHNNLSGDLQQIVSEGRQAYQMDYYPGDKDWDGKYHKIELKLTPEHKGLTLLCRKGYFATDNLLAPSYENFREAARSPVETEGIELTLDVPSNPIEWGPEQVVLKLNVHDIQFEQKGEKANANLGVAFVQLGKNGRVLEGFLDNVNIALQPDTYADAEQQGWFYTRDLILSGYAAKLRVVVRDRATGAMGTVSVPIHMFSMKNTK